MIFTARPDGAAGVLETYGYETDVMTAWDGSEQRTLLRELPTRSLRLTVIFADAVDVTEEMGKIFASGQAPLDVPYWPDATRLTQTATAGATTIYFLTAGRGFVAGGALILWRDQWTYEVANINAVFSDHVTLVGGGVTNTWSLFGTVAIPATSMRILSEPVLNRLAGEVATIELELGWEAA